MDTLAYNITNRIPTLLVGPPGCGKTARVAAAADVAQHRLIVLRLSLCERVDVSGCIVPDLASGTARLLPLEVLADLQTTKEPTVLLLDDLGQAPTDVQAAAMRLFDAGFLSPSVVIMGATNRPQDRAGCQPLCEPLRSRFAEAYSIATPGVEETASTATFLGDWSQELDNWTTWAWEQPGISPEIIAWHRSTQGRTLYAWQPAQDPAFRLPDFRSWAHVIRLFAAGIRSLQRIAATIGKPAAAEFLAFCDLAGQVPTPDEVWLDPTGAPVPKASAAQYMIAAMLANAVTGPYAAPFVTYIARLPRPYTGFAARDAFRRIGPDLSRTREWSTWFLANQALFQS